MQKYISKRVLENYSLEDTGIYNSKNIQIFQTDIEEGILDRQMLAIIGDAGTGKSVLFGRIKNKFERHAMPYNKIHFCYVHNFNKEMMSAGSIMDAILMDIAPGEKRAGKLEARSRQFTRVVGERLVNHNELIVLVIEEAHRLNIDLFRSLKEMREAEYLRTAQLFSVVLIGHELLAHKLKQRNETNWRTRTLLLTESNGWFDFDERVDYLKVKYKNAIQAEARRRIAIHCKLPLEMDEFVRVKMEEGMKAGKKILDSDVVQPTVQEMWDTLKRENPESISYRKVAKEMGGISPSSIAPILVGKSTKKNENKLRKALLEISNKNKSERIERRDVI